MEATRRQFEEQATLLRQAAEAQVTQAGEKLAEVQCALSKLQKSNGKTVAELKRAETELEELRGGTSGTKSAASSGKAARPWYEGSRALERRVKALEKEVEAARANDAELRRALEDAHAKPAEREARRRKEALMLPAAMVRVSQGEKKSYGCAEAPLLARTYEFIRRTVCESNQSMEGLQAANALLLQLHTGQTPDPERLFCRNTTKAAFMKLGCLDQLAEAAANAVVDGQRGCE